MKPYSRISVSQNFARVQHGRRKKGKVLFRVRPLYPWVSHVRLRVSNMKSQATTENTKGLFCSVGKFIFTFAPISILPAYLFQLPRTALGIIASHAKSWGYDNCLWWQEMTFLNSDFQLRNMDVIFNHVYTASPTTGKGRGVCLGDSPLPNLNSPKLCIGLKKKKKNKLQKKKKLQPRRSGVVLVLSTALFVNRTQKKVSIYHNDFLVNRSKDLSFWNI